MAKLISELPSKAPSVVPAEVVAAGATAIRHVFPTDVIPGILEAYLAGIRVAFAIGIGGIGCGALAAVLGRWKRLSTHATKDAVAI